MCTPRHGRQDCQHAVTANTELAVASCTHKRTVLNGSTHIGSDIAQVDNQKIVAKPMILGECDQLRWHCRSPSSQNRRLALALPLAFPSLLVLRLAFPSLLVRRLAFPRLAFPRLGLVRPLAFPRLAFPSLAFPSLLALRCRQLVPMHCQLLASLEPLRCLTQCLAQREPLRCPTQCLEQPAR